VVELKYSPESNLEKCGLDSLEVFRRMACPSVPRKDPLSLTHARDEQNDPPFVVAIDGPAGAGKSTVASMLARRLGVPHLDTGAMYRAVALLALRAGIELPLDENDSLRVRGMMGDHTIELERAEHGTAVLVDGEDVSGEIRTQECSLMASAVSALSDVRRELVRIQRSLGERQGGVMEGRDIGTVVFPDARLKIFLTASTEERSQRRFDDLQQLDTGATLDDVREQQRLRDRQDSSREDSPLKVAAGAVVVDTTRMTPEEVVERVVEELLRSGLQSLDSRRGKP
jgi:cytidylate kinase